MVAAGGIAVSCGAPAASWTTARPHGRPGGRLRLLGADAQLPGGGRNQWPPARRRPAGDLVGRYTGALCVAVVLLVQALLFADGGLTALGVNVINMSLVTVVVGYAVFRLLVRAPPD